MPTPIVADELSVVQAPVAVLDPILSATVKLDVDDLYSINYTL
jgi:hypothetical protein